MTTISSISVASETVTRTAVVVWPVLAVVGGRCDVACPATRSICFNIASGAPTGGLHGHH